MSIERLKMFSFGQHQPNFFSDSQEGYMSKTEVSRYISQIQQRCINLGLDEDLINKAFSCDIPIEEVQYQISKNEQKQLSKIEVSSLSQEKITICLNYTEKCHALFGDFAKTYSFFKDGYLKRMRWIKPGPKLAFGFGWLIVDKTKLSEIMEALEKSSIPFRKIERLDYDIEIRNSQK